MTGNLFVCFILVLIISQLNGAVILHDLLNPGSYSKVAKSGGDDANRPEHAMSSGSLDNHKPSENLTNIQGRSMSRENILNSFRTTRLGTVSPGDHNPGNKFFPQYSLSDLSAYTTIDQEALKKKRPVAQDRYSPSQYTPQFMDHGDDDPKMQAPASSPSKDSYGSQENMYIPPKDLYAFPPNDNSAYDEPTKPDPPPKSKPNSGNDDMMMVNGPGSGQPSITYPPLGEGEYYTPPPGYKDSADAGPSDNDDQHPAPTNYDHGHHHKPFMFNIPPDGNFPTAPSDQQAPDNGDSGDDDSKPSGQSPSGPMQPANGQKDQMYPELITDDSHYPHHHDFSGYNFYHDHHHHPPPPPPPPTTMQPEEQDERVNNKFSYYYIGRKLWYIPLYFSIYFIVYVAVLIAKAIARHKFTLPDHWKAREMIPEPEQTTEDIHHTAYITNLLSQAEEKYH